MTGPSTDQSDSRCGLRHARSLDVNASIMKPRMLQVNKELQKDHVVDLVDQLRLPAVDYLHLIA